MSGRWVSRRAERWLGNDPQLVRAHFKCATDPYSPDVNPGGFVNFGTAENHLLWSALAPLLEEDAALREADAHYNALHGAAYLREPLAQFLAPRAGRPISPGDLAVASGASAALEILSFAIADPGDAILIPAPYYSGFDHDLALRSGAELVPVQLAPPEFRLCAEAIEAARAGLAARGRRVAALLLNSPQNPLGQIYEEGLLREIVAAAEREEMQVIVDEVYAESLLPGERHFSCLAIESPSLHVVYGFAKDFGLSGYKVGVVHSRNRGVIEAVQALCYFHPVSQPAQRMLAGLLRSVGLPGFLDTARERLAQAHRVASGALGSMNVPVLPVAGGIVLWLDLRARLREPSFAAERELWQEIFTEAKVSITPGGGFHCSEPGWFRLCFTVPSSHLREGLRRLAESLN